MSDLEEQVIAQVEKKLFIGGTWKDAASGATFGVEDPSTREELCRVADANDVDGLAALATAHWTQPSWAQLAPRERGEILRRSHELLMERQEELGTLMTFEMGRPLAEAKGGDRLRRCVLPLVLRGSRSCRWQLRHRTQRRSECPAHEAAGRPVTVHPPLELTD